MGLFERVIQKSRDYRSNKLHAFGAMLHKVGISANILTTFSLIFGLIAIFFIFRHYWYFVLFSVLHLFADAFDGVVARINGPTFFGKAYDQFADGLFVVLITLKIGQHLQDNYAYIVAILFAAMMFLYFLSRMEAIVIIPRTIVILLTLMYFPNIMNSTISLLIVAYLTVGVAAVYSLAKQLQWFIKSYFF